MTSQTQSVARRLRRVRQLTVVWGRDIDSLQAIRLSGWLFAVGGAQALVTVWFLSDRVQTTALTTSALVALAGAVGMLAVPARWATPGLAQSTPFLAAVLLSAGAGAWGGALHFYVALYSLTFLYAGLTQSRRYGLTICVVAMIGAALSTLGNEPLRVLPFLLCSIATSAFIGLVLESCMAHQRREQDALEVILATGETLHECNDPSAAARALIDAGRGLLGADGALVVLSEVGSPHCFRGVAAAGVDVDATAIVVDTSEGDTGAAAAIRAGRAVFVSDVGSSHPPAAEWMATSGVTSVLFVPINGHDGVTFGAQVYWWQRLAADPSPRSLHELEILTRYAAQALHRLRAMAQLHEAARTDALTGLPNRRILNTALDELAVGAGIVMCDLDFFKTFNDRHGHDAGDRLLVSFAAVLQEHIRGGDTACRFGGEEFALVTGTSALAVVERVRAAWMLLSDVTFSAGVAVRATGEPATVTLARADRALYQAKRTGRNRIVVDGGAVPDPRLPMPRDVQQLESSSQLSD